MLVNVAMAAPTLRVGEDRNVEFRRTMDDVEVLQH
jgi:hypothetical protein